MIIGNCFSWVRFAFPVFVFGVAVQVTVRPGHSGDQAGTLQPPCPPPRGKLHLSSHLPVRSERQMFFFFHLYTDRIWVSIIILFLYPSPIRSYPFYTVFHSWSQYNTSQLPFPFPIPLRPSPRQDPLPMSRQLPIPGLLDHLP